MKYRQGDKVSVLGIVKHNQRDDSERIFIQLVDYHDEIWIRPDIVKLVEAHFEVGDHCTFTYHDNTDEVRGTGVILAISDGHAWIDRGGGDYCTRMLSTIERVDSDE